MNFYKKIVLVLITLILYFPGYAHSIPAFPGAEGFGANVIGGRGGRVMKVTNLNDSGPGSFREAIEASGSRIVVFDVSGIINLESTLELLNPNITIAGESSPGGILVTGYSFLVQTHQVIIRHMRFRVGSHKISEGANAEFLDSFVILGERWGNQTPSHDIIIDHSSMGWGVDETLAVSGGVMNSTIQWSMVSEGLRNAGHPDGTHSKGMMISGKYVYPSSLSLHHNYIAHNTDRSPLIYAPVGVEMLVDYVNNVSYNWKGGLSPLGSAYAKINWVQNYSKPGFNSHAWSFEVTHDPDNRQSPSPLIYVRGNIGGSRMSQSEPHWNVGTHFRNILLPRTWERTTPWPAPPITTAIMSADVATCILSAVGAVAPVRDSADSRVIADFSPGTGAIRDDVIFPDDFPTFQNLPAPVDIDNDGMADSWEVTADMNVGLNDSALDNDGNGYTNIEEYLHYLSAKSYAYDPQCMPDMAVVAMDTTPPSPPTNLRVN